MVAFKLGALSCLQGPYDVGVVVAGELRLAGLQQEWR
jgi:hypothetical protein